MDLSNNYEEYHYSRNSIKINEKILTIILILTFFRPHFKFIPEVISVYWPDLLILILSIFHLTRYTGIQLSIKTKKLRMLEILFLLLLFIPISINFLFNGLSLDTLLAYFKIVYYYIVLITVYDLVKNTQGIMFKIDKIIHVCFLGNFIVSMIQLLEIPFLFDITALLFNTEKLRTIWSGYARVYGAFYNANWYGVYLIFNLAWLNEQIINKSVKTSWYIMNIVPLALMFVVSGSRTAILGAMIATTIQFLRGARFIKIIKILALFLPVLLFLVISIKNIDLLSRTFNRFTSFIDEIINNGVSIEVLAGSRWPEWINAFQVFKESPWVGSSIENFIPHNSYLSALIRFGIIGGIIIFIFICSVSHRFKNRIKKNREMLYFNLTRSGFIWSFLVVSLGGDYWFSTQIMLIFIICISVSYSYFENIKLIISKS